MKKSQLLGAISAVLFIFVTVLANAAVVYELGLAPTDSTLVFGDHLVAPQNHPSIAGTGGTPGISNNGDVLNGFRTYIYDKGGSQDLADQVANRGDSGFAMLIWDMGSSFDSLRLYTHQDHYSGGLVTTDFVAQDLMEYSVWGSHDGDNFDLLSDVINFNIDGGGTGLPTYTFSGTEPTIVWRGGSEENSIVNAYTREYVFMEAYQYYGIRTSSISISADDADPEIDAIAAFNTLDRCTVNPDDPSCVGVVPIPPTAYLFVSGLLGLIGISRRKKVA